MSTPSIRVATSWNGSWNGVSDPPKKEKEVSCPCMHICKLVNTTQSSYLNILMSTERVKFYITILHMLCALHVLHVLQCYICYICYMCYNVTYVTYVTCVTMLHMLHMLHVLHMFCALHVLHMLASW
jgi:hypothetical protein